MTTLGGSWFRFVVTGQVTGGKLKTPADADSESLQAKWIADLRELSLRSNDIINIVERGRQYLHRGKDIPWHLPQVNCYYALLRVLTDICQKSFHAPNFKVVCLLLVRLLHTICNT